MHSEHVNRSQAVLLGVDALEKVADRRFDVSEIEICFIERDLGFRKLSKEDSQEYLDELSKKRG